jgi:poly(A) polymerase
MNLHAEKRIAALLAEPDVSAVVAMLNTDGEEGRIVGGAVRNLLLDLPISDIDLATTALPQTVMARAEKHGWKTVPTGLAHGTVTVVINKQPFEITTLRADIDTDGRRATIAMTRDFAVDAARRDFTINALSLSADGKVHDYGRGLDDIAARRIRFFGEPERRIREDYLRILRFYRFSARYGAGPLDAEGRAACAALHPGMAILSGERIGMEMLKLLDPLTPRTIDALEAMAADQVLAQSLGGPGDVQAVGRLAAQERAFDVPREALRWLMALAVREPADAERVTARLKLSRAQEKRISRVSQMEQPAESQRCIDAWLYRHGKEAIIDQALIQLALGHWSGPSRRLWVEAAARRAESWVPPAFPIKAKDMALRGLAPGPAMGKALWRAEEHWLATGLPLDEPSLQRIADQAASG